MESFGAFDRCSLHVIWADVDICLFSVNIFHKEEGAAENCFAGSLCSFCNQYIGDMSSAKGFNIIF